MKERKHRKRTIKREKLRRKREKRLEEEIIKERRRRKALMRHMKHKQKLAKKIMSSHWSTRKMSEERKKEILKEVHGESFEGSNLGSCSKMGSEGERRPSTRSSTSVWSSTSGGGSSWYGGSQIHHRASLCVYSEGDEGGEGEDLSDDTSVTSSGDTAINME